ncbi:MAG: hypothetical protein ACI8UC_001181 [Psychromonas sp.]
MENRRSKYNNCWSIKFSETSIELANRFLTGMIASFLIVPPWRFELPNTGGESIIVVSLASLLVGFGTRLDNGCTSGHGIIGLSQK